MVVMPHLLKPKAKKEINIKHNPEAWILIESYNNETLFLPNRVF
jgi:hypothetical protein